MSDERRWTAAAVEHDLVVRAFKDVCAHVPPADWHPEPAPGKWSAAAVALHVCQSYELGRDAVDRGAGMRLRVAPSVAWLSRTVLLPLFLVTRRFPRGATAPVELRPDLSEARRLTPNAASARLEHAAGEAIMALRRAAAERPVPTVSHAYFGALSPYSALRLLSAHTRHHARGLLARP